MRKESNNLEKKIFKFKAYTFEEMLKEKGYLVYTNLGTSMLPLLRQRQDIIEIHAKGPNRFRKYDVVLYKRGSMYILHRVLKVLPNGYLIAGDNNTFIERDVTDDMILGVMTRVIRNGKSITPDNFWYRCYVHLWCDCYPLRFFILRVLRKARTLGHNIKAKANKGKWGKDGGKEA